VPTRVVDDLRAPAAAVLAGGWFLAGKARSLLAGAFLPAAMLLVTIWLVRVWNLTVWGHSMQMLLLIAMVVLAQQAAGWAVSADRAERRWSVAVAALAVGGLLVLAAAGSASAYWLKMVLRVGGLVLSLAGAGLVVARALSRKRREGCEARAEKPPP
jgi:hypothetical protein